MVLPKPLAKAILPRCFGRGDIGEVTKDGGEANHAEELGKGDAGVDTKGIDEAPRGEVVSRENAPELIGCIF